MAEVFLRGTLDETGVPRQRGGGSLQRLSPRLLIGPEDMRPVLGDRWRVLGHRTDCGPLGGTRHGGIWLGGEPGVHARGLASDLMLKNARHGGC